MKEWGVPQVSEFYWVDGVLWDRTMQSDYETSRTPDRSEWVSAFLVSELMQILPSHIEVKENFAVKPYEDIFFYWLGTSKSDDGEYHIHYADDERLPEIFPDWDTIKDTNLSEACAKMLIFLLENHIITI